MYYKYLALSRGRKGKTKSVVLAVRHPFQLSVHLGKVSTSGGYKMLCLYVPRAKTKCLLTGGVRL